MIPTGRGGGGGGGIGPLVRHEPTIAPIKRRLQVSKLINSVANPDKWSLISLSLSCIYNTGTLSSTQISVIVAIENRTNTSVSNNQFQQ
jgi:hypothetical protein